MFDEIKVLLRDDFSIVLPESMLKKYPVKKNEIFVFEGIKNPASCVVMRCQRS